MVTKLALLLLMTHVHVLKILQIPKSSGTDFFNTVVVKKSRKN